ncbi:unnamed protein product, partial [Phaeothamnion confervicola]
LRGAEYVVAPVQPVPDFYMPLFTCLLHQAWQRCGEPHAALLEAKRRLRARAWYEDTARYLASAYRKVMKTVLARAQTDLATAGSVGAWPMPAAV